MRTREEKIELLRTKKPFSLPDLIIYGLILVAVAAVIILLTRPAGEKVNVYYTDSGGIERIYTRELSEEGEFSLPDAGFDFVIVIEGGSVSVKNSSCDNQICVHWGKIGRAGQSIVCSPNKVYIEIVGKDIADNRV